MSELSDIESVSPVEAIAPKSGPYGSGMTLLWMVIIGFFYLVTQTVALLMYAISTGWDLSEAESVELLSYQGDCVSLVTILSGAVTLPLILLAIKLRRNGPGFASYLSFRAIRWKSLLMWVGILILWIGIMSLSGWVFQVPVPDFMSVAASTARYPALLLLAVGLVAPIIEELYFRGFLYAGWERSWLGPHGTIVLSSLMFALIHVQYGPYLIGTIFFTGMLFGYSRKLTGNLWIPVLLHALMNLVASIQTWIYVQP